MVEEEKEEEELTRFVHVKTFSPRICHRKQKRKTTGANKSTRKEKLSWLLSKGATLDMSLKGTCHHFMKLIIHGLPYS